MDKVEKRVTDNKDEIDILQFHNKSLRVKLSVQDGIEHPTTTSAFSKPKERTPTPVLQDFSSIPIVEAIGKRARKPPTASKSSPVMHLQARKKAKLQQRTAVEQLNKALKIEPDTFECKECKDKSDL